MRKRKGNKRCVASRTYLIGTNYAGAHTTSPYLPCSIIKWDGCCARRRIQCLLRTTVQDVNIWEWNKRLIISHTSLWQQTGILSFVIVLLCLSIKIGAAPSEATVSTRKRQLCLREVWQIAVWTMTLCLVIACNCLFCVLFETGGEAVSLSADVSNTIYWVTEASGGLSMCEEKQDRFVFFYGLKGTGVRRV